MVIRAHLIVLFDLIQAIQLLVNSTVKIKSVFGTCLLIGNDRTLFVQETISCVTNRIEICINVEGC
jgi:hypothetical protein